MNKYKDEFSSEISEENSATFQRFLKKPEKIDTQERRPENSRPKTSRGTAPDVRNVTNYSMNKRTDLSLSALNRFNDLEAKIKQRQTNFKALNLSNSDYDLDLSSDLDVKESVGKGHVKLRNKLRPQNITEVGNFNLAEFSSSSEDDSSAKFRFVKKSSQAVLSGSDTENSSTSSETNQNSRIKSAPSKKVSFLSPDQSSEVSLDDFMPQRSISETHSISSLDDFAVSTNLHNVMTLDDLLVADPIHQKPIIENKSSVHYSSDFEISTDKVSYHSDVSKEDSYSESSHKNFLNIQSVEDLQAFDEPMVTKNNPTESAEEVSENYTDDFNDTLKETDSIISDSIKEEIDFIKTDSTISESISQQSSTKSTLTEDSYSTLSASDYSSELPSDNKNETKKTLTIKKETKSTEIGTQTQSSSTEQFSFVPSRLVNNEAIDVLTNYNPATLAIQDLLKQQVNLTKEFMAQSKRMHTLANESIPCDYVYGAVDIKSLDRYRKILNK